MQNGPLELLDKELKPLQVFPAGNQWKPHRFELFDWILLLAGEIVELLLHLVDLSLQVGHLIFTAWARFRFWSFEEWLMVTSNEKSHLLQGQSLYWSKGSLRRYLMMALWSFLLRLLIILVESLSQYHHQYHYDDHHHYRGNIIPSSQSSQVTPATFVWSSVGSLQRGHIHQKYLVDMIMMIVMIVMEIDMMIIKMRMIYKRAHTLEVPGWWWWWSR